MSEPLPRDLLLANLELITADLNHAIADTQDHQILLADSIAIMSTRLQLVQAYASLDLAAQQRAANLLWLARMGDGPISDAYVGEARKLIGPILVGDQ
jgi:hypothetical protein